MGWVGVLRWVHELLIHGGVGRCCNAGFLGEYGVWSIEMTTAPSSQDSSASGCAKSIGYEGYCCDTCGYVRLSGAQFCETDDNVTIRTTNKHGIAPWSV